MTATQPTIVIIPGSYSPITFYTDFKHALVASGLDVRLSDLPSASGAPSLPPADLAADAAHFLAIIAALVDQQKTVVVFAHSYGGLVARETLATAKLSVAFRQTQGQRGGVSRIVYLSAMLSTPPDNSMQFFATYAANLPWLTEGITDVVDPDTEGGPQYVRQNPIKAAPYFFNDLPHADAVKWTVRMSMHTMAAWLSNTHKMEEDANSIPTTYIKCLQDTVFPPAFQDEMIKLLVEERKMTGADPQIDVKEIDSAHFPSVTRTDVLADLVKHSLL